MLLESQYVEALALLFWDCGQCTAEFSFLGQKWPENFGQCQNVGRPMGFRPATCFGYLLKQLNESQGDKATAVVGFPVGTPLA